MGSVADEVAELESKVYDLDSDLCDARNEIDRLKVRVEQLEQENDDLTQQVVDTREDRDAIESECNTVLEERDALLLATGARSIQELLDALKN